MSILKKLKKLYSDEYKNDLSKEELDIIREEILDIIKNRIKPQNNKEEDDTLKELSQIYTDVVNDNRVKVTVDDNMFNISLYTNTNLTNIILNEYTDYLFNIGLIQSDRSADDIVEMFYDYKLSL